MKVRAHLYIYGDVTGVGYRAWTFHHAKQRRLTGWVRNAGKGVEAVFEGEKETVEQMLKHCKKGPDVAWVEKVELKWEEAIDETEFKILMD